MTAEAAPRMYCSRCLTTFDADQPVCANLTCRRPRPPRGWGRICSDGEVFDRSYRVHQLLAMGGAGVTYIARELDDDSEETGPLLAVKVLLAARDQGPYVRRLATEAQIIQELDHPNIVEYLGFVHRSGHSPYLITRYESGGSLLDHMRRVGRLTVREAAVVARQICWALEKAHERGIIHRDLKPENLLIARPVQAGEEPVIRVADFGIAKVQGSLGSNLTRVGAFVGTPHYAAPEQFVGGSITEAADVYAVGAIVYFCVTARHVAKFTDRLEPEDGFQHLVDHLPPVLSEVGEDPVDVQRMNQVLAVAMSVDPSRRCTVVDLDSMLGELVAGRAPTVVQPRRAEPTDEISIGMASVMGLAGVAEQDSHDLAGASNPASVGEPEVTRESLAPNATAIPHESPSAEAAPTPTLEPVVTPPPEPAVDSVDTGALAPADSPVSPSGPGPDPAPHDDPPAPRRRNIGLIVGVMAVLGLGFVAAVAAVALTQMPDVADLWLGAPTALERGVPGSDSRKDWDAVQSSALKMQDELQRACSIQPGSAVKVNVVIEGDGSVRRATPGAGGGAAVCAASALGAKQLKRRGAGPVSVELGWKW